RTSRARTCTTAPKRRKTPPKSAPAASHDATREKTTGAARTTRSVPPTQRAKAKRITRPATYNTSSSLKDLDFRHPQERRRALPPHHRRCGGDPVVSAGPLLLPLGPSPF